MQRDTTLGAIDELLEGVLADTTDPEVNYRIRTARQLLSVVQQRLDSVDRVIDEADLDAETLAGLRELGYLE